MLDRKIRHILKFLLLFSHFFVQAQNIDVEKEIENIIEMRNQDLEKTIKYTDSLLQYDFPNKIKIKIEKGLTYILSNELEKSVLVFNKVIHTLVDDEKMLEDLGNAYIGISQAYMLLDNTDESMKNIFKGLEVGKKLKDPSFESRAFSVISIIYFRSKDYSNSIKYERKSIDIIRQDKNREDFSEKISPYYQNIAVAFQKLNQLDSALYYNEKVIQINNKDNNMAALHNNMAVIYQRQKKYNQAVNSYKKAIKMHQLRNSNSVNPLVNLARLYINIRKYDLAKEYYLKALSIAVVTNDRKKQEQIYSSLLNTAIKQKDYKNSLRFQQKRDSLNQVNLTKNNKDKLQMLNTQFEQRKKEERLKQKLTLNKKNNIILYTTISLLLFIGLFFLQKYSNSQLKLKQDKLILEQKILRSQMTPHFIFNSLSVLQGMILNKEDSKAVSYLSKFSKLLRITLDNSREKLVALDEELIAIQNYVDLNNMRSLTKFNYILLLDKSVKKENFLVPPMLIQPFIENAILHGFNKKFTDAEISINITFKNDMLLCIIKDNGFGVNKSRNTEKTKKSLSTTITKERLDFFSKEYKVKCNLEIQDRSVFNEKGTQVSLTLPYKTNNDA